MKTIRKISTDYEQVIDNFPKLRQPLPKDYLKIYDEHYASNRLGGTKAAKASGKLEEWMHKMVAADTAKNAGLHTLEIGAGSLNQLDFENTTNYDIVEPYTQLFKDSPHIGRIHNIYSDISEIEGEYIYDRITSVAAFEHILNLPDVVKMCIKLLKSGGTLRVGIPNEGRFLWKAAYKLTTGVEFKRNYGLDYSVLMNYEHVNTADEIEKILLYYFNPPHVKRAFFGLGRTFSLYRYYECKKDF